MAKMTATWLIFVTFGIILAVTEARSFYNVDVTYEITLNAYSGRGNPTWTVTSRHPMYHQIAWAVNNGPPTEMYKGLGYCGFTVNARNAIGQTAWKTVGRHKNRMLETMLLESCPETGLISVPLMNHVSSGIYGQLPSTTIEIFKRTDDENQVVFRRNIYKRKKRQAAIRCSTRFEPSAWNYEAVQRNNNCYNYATNIQTNTFAQPGRASGQRYTRTEARNVYAAAVRDGLTPLSGRNAGGQCLIALVIWPGEDYHFLRLDSDGFWSQKSGRTAARNTDDSGNRIRDPRRADRGPYTVFAGYLGISENVIVR